MDALELVYKTYGGHDINSADGSKYVAKGVLKGAPILASSNPIYTSRSNNFPVDGGIELSGKQFSLVIVIRAGGTLEELTKWFDTSDESTYALVANDANGAGWFINARTVGFDLNPGEMPTANIKLYAADPIWQKVTAQSVNWDITASGQTQALTVVGNKFARPVFTISPTAARSGSFTYKRYIAIANRTSLIYKDAINIVDSNWDTAAIVSDSKMLASGDDLRIINDETGAEEYRWFGGGGINSSTTRVFININLPPKTEMTIKNAISNSGAVASVIIASTAANLAALKQLALTSYKFVAIDMGTGTSEIFKFTTVNVSTYTISGMTRAQQGSTNQSHSAGATLRHIHGFFVMYGNAGALPPTTDDTYKPLINLATSTNTSRVWENFYDVNNPNRTCQWQPQIIYRQGGNGAQSELYTATQDTKADIASVIGIANKPYTYMNVIRGAADSMGWGFYHPAGVTTLTWSGYKYVKYGTVFFRPTATMQKSNDGTTYANVVATEAIPTLDSWTAVSYSAVSLSGTFLYIRLYTFGGVDGILGNMGALEVGDVTAVLDSNTVPLISFEAAARENNYEEFTLTNTVASVVQWTITIAQMIPVNDFVVIDTEKLESYTHENVPVRVALDDESRTEWCPLTPGATNTLTYTEVGANGVDITIHWHDRSL